MASLLLTLNRDSTITVRVGAAVEHVSLEGKTRGEVFDAVKWAAISKGAHPTDVELTQQLYYLYQQ